MRGIGPVTIRGLALISELIYGAKASWKDPVKYSFAFGGKDGVPFPVDRKSMDQSAEFLEDALNNSFIKKSEKLKALERLRKLIS
jgi:hypothetical protein